MTAPLAGIRVLDFCWVGAGALVTQLLAEHGAEVIKVESRARPDNLRVAPPYRDDVEDLDGSGYFASRNANKKSFALNMRHPDAPAIARALADHSSIVTSNFRPGVLDRWGLSYDVLSEKNPSLIYLTMPMQGETGPHASFVGFGSTIAALAGLVYLSGAPNRTPVGTGTHYPDHVPNPGHALVALLGAIYRRRRTGEGARIELAQLESTVNVLGPAVTAAAAGGRHAERTGNRVSDAAPRGVFPCRGEDRWCAISVRSEAEWRAVARVLDRPQWLADERFATLSSRKAHEDELEADVAAATSAWEPWQLMDALQREHVPAAVVETTADLLDVDPHLAARGFWHRLDHPVMGRVVANGLPFRSTTSPTGPTSPAPLLGEHTWDIAGSLLDMDRDEFDRLTDSGVLR